MKRQFLVLALIACLGAASDAAAESDIKRLDGSRITPPEIDGTVTRLMRDAEVTGASISILNDAKVVFQKSYGFRDKEKDLPLTPDSIVTAASFSKVAFGYLVMKLVDDGILSLDKPVYEYLPKPLPEYSAYQDLANDLRYKKITARMLLSHTCGFPNWRWFNKDHKLNINFEPGSRYAYSGEGIALLQLVVETITKRPLQDLMQERVFQPLAMTRTGMVWLSRFESDFANGYDEWGRSLGPQRRPTADAAGSMQTTLGDFTRFVQAVMQGKGLRKETKQQMLSPQIQIASKHQFPTLEDQPTDENKAIRLSYGLGWGLFWTPYGKAFFKEGHDEGWRNYTVCFDEVKTAIVIMTNSSNGEGIFKELLETLLRNTFTPIVWEGYTPYNELPPRKPLKEHKEIVVDPRILTRYIGRYGEPPNLILIVRQEGDHLSLQENDESKQEVFAESENRFFSKVSDDEITFEVDAGGRVTRMIIRTGGQNIPIKRLD